MSFSLIKLFIIINSQDINFDMFNRVSVKHTIFSEIKKSFPPVFFLFFGVFNIVRFIVIDNCFFVHCCVLDLQ